MTKAYIWKRFDNKCVIQVEDPKLAQKIKKWSFSEGGSFYGVNYFMKQFLIPASKRQFACRALKVPYEKNPNRVIAGKAAAKKNPLKRGQKS